MTLPPRPWTSALFLLAAFALAPAFACSTTDDANAGGGVLLADGGHSLPNHCMDGQKDDDESDVDCGGSACSKCAGSKACKSGTDCASTACQASGTCTFPSDTDGVKNGTESDVDCGGDASNPRCADGKTCGAASDCVSLVCGAAGAGGGGTCSAPTFSDGVRNGNESDVDCGGGAPPVLATPDAGPPSPADAGADAGGRVVHVVSVDGGADAAAAAPDAGNVVSVSSDGAPACAQGKTCRVNDDCATLACAPSTHTCVPASAMDGYQDGSETDVDCGGSGGAVPCASGDGCRVAADCASAVCTKDLCAVATSSDNVKNEGETDIDCGGPSAPTCPTGKACLQHGDCSSNGCDDSMHCALGISCTQAHGGYSCGGGETGDPAAAHESCCTALPVTGAPSGDFLLDKYVITAGRMRQFVTRTGGDVRGYIQKNYPPGWDTTWDSWLPAGMQDLAGDSIGGVYTQLGPLNYGVAGGGNEGCYVVGPGARSYYFTDAQNSIYQNGNGLTEVQSYGQDIGDEKAQNCVNAFMLMAFCAWDGGHLASVDELDYAWFGGDAARTFPWGPTPTPAGYDMAYGDAQGAMGHQVPATGDPTIAAYSYNYWWPSELVSNDQTVYIPAPGRFTRNIGPFGHMDLAGVAMEITSTLSGSDGTNPSTRSATWSRAGSWEGHPVGFAGYAFPMTNKYIAATGRCAR